MILMDLTFPPEAEAFRERLRRFLRDNLPPDSCCCRQTNPASRSGRSGRSPGHAEFCEFFFTDATASTDHVIGGVNNGWKTAVSLLGFERSSSAAAAARVELDRLAELIRRRGRAHDPLIRQRFGGAGRGSPSCAIWHCGR